VGRRLRGYLAEGQYGSFTVILVFGCRTAEHRRLNCTSVIEGANDIRFFRLIKMPNEHLVLNILCVTCSNEMAAVHLTKTYCLTTLMYGCETWTLTDNSLHIISVAWNNCFRRIFKCCWRDSTKSLQFFCKTMSIAHLIDQRKMIFGKK